MSFSTQRAGHELRIEHVESIAHVENLNIGADELELALKRVDELELAEYVHRGRLEELERRLFHVEKWTTFPRPHPRPRWLP